MKIIKVTITNLFCFGFIINSFFIIMVQKYKKSAICVTYH